MHRLYANVSVKDLSIVDFFIHRVGPEANIPQIPRDDCIACISTSFLFMDD